MNEHLKQRLSEPSVSRAERTPSVKVPFARVTFALKTLKIEERGQKTSPSD
jgi:hypothetical protein